MTFSAVILNWEEIGVVSESVRLLLKEPDTEVIVVDNGSLDASREFLVRQQNVRSIFLETNMGSSVARNMGISSSRAPYVFMLDGDIRYVPGSLATLKRALDLRADWGCAGVYGSTASVGDRESASQRFDEFKLSQLRTNFPVAWTQYGLFRGKVFMDGCWFDETGYFGMPGHGFEDDDLYMQMKKKGWKSGHIKGAVKYYHEQSTGKVNLQKYGLPHYFNERSEQFNAKWGL